MMWPPSVVRIRIVKHGRRKRNLWLPVFLLWPIVVALGAAVAPFIVLACVATRRAKSVCTVLRAGPRAFAALCALRGLRVHVIEPDEEVYIAVW